MLIDALLNLPFTFLTTAWGVGVGVALLAPFTIGTQCQHSLRAAITLIHAAVLYCSRYWLYTTFSQPASVLLGLGEMYFSRLHVSLVIGDIIDHIPKRNYSLLTLFGPLKNVHLIIWPQTDV